MKTKKQELITLEDIKRMEQPFKDIGMRVSFDNGPDPRGDGKSTAVWPGEDYIVWKNHSTSAGEISSGSIVDAYMFRYGISDKNAIKMLKDKYGDTENVINIEDFKRQQKKKKPESKKLLQPVDVSGVNPPSIYEDSQGKRRTKIYRGSNEALEFGKETLAHITGGMRDDNVVLISVMRWECEDGKQIRPLYKVNDSEWALGLPDEYIKPLYNAYDIMTKKDAEVWVVEGEKCMERLQQACADAKRMYKDTFPDVVVTTSIGGSNNPGTSDWEILKSHEKVKIIPDKDEPGMDYAKFVLGKAPKAKVLDLPIAEKEDVYDWLENGGDVRCLTRSDFEIEWGGDEEDEVDPRYMMLSTGSDTEISDMMLGKHDIIYDGVDIWEYDSRERSYKELTKTSLINELSKLDGIEKVTGKTLTMSHNKKMSVIKDMKARREYPDFFENSVESINFSDRIVKIVDRKIVAREYRKSDRVRNKMDIKYDPYKRPTLFEAYLEDIFGEDDDGEDKKIFLQEFTGACLFGMAHNFAKALILSGEGSNGKSLFLQIFNQFFHNEDIANVSLSNLSSNSSNVEYYKIQLMGKKINTLDELADSSILNSDGIKSIISGDVIMGRHPSGTPTSFRPRVGMVMSTNTLPPVKDTSDGFWRRWIVLEFNKFIKEEDRDPDLGKKIIEQDKQGLINWAIEGAQRILDRDNHKYHTVPSSEEALERWRESADRVLLFINREHLVPAEEDDESKWVQAKDLYKRYSEWSKENGFNPLASDRFFKRMSKTFDKHKSSVIYYKCKFLFG